MRINHNIAALNTYRQLNSASGAQSKSMEKLASGLRINKAGDDAAGLAISEKMRGQIRGLDQASSNAQNGISLIQTAEGALNETHSILQRMKELATQASSDTNTAADREKIQDEINQLTSEVNRIGNTTEFNTKTLLNGNIGGGNVNASTSGAKMSGGADAVQAQYKIVIGAGAADGDTVTFDGVTFEFDPSADAATPGNVVVLGDSDTDAPSAALHLYEAMRNDAGLSAKWDITMNKDGEILATAKVGGAADGNAGNSAGIATFTGVAGSSSTSVTPGADAVRAQGEITFTDKPQAGSYITIGDKTVAFIDSSDTATWDFDKSGAINGTDVLDAFAAKGVTLSGSVANVDYVDINGKDLATIMDDLDTAIVAVAGNVTTRSENGPADSGHSSYSIRLEADAAGKAANDLAISVHNAPAGLGSSAIKLQVGANNAQSFSIDVADMRSAALKISGEAANDATGVAGASYVTKANVTDGTQATNEEFALDVSTHDKATAAIEVIDNAINTVSKERAKLGSFQNRLEHTINNLNTSSENLTAAESRIRDVDMAKEMMNQTKNSILSQAAQAMLAQANQQPQGVLQLLR